MTTPTEVFEPGPIGEATRLAASQCPLCGRIQFPRLVDCPVCGTTSQELWLAGPAELVFATRVLADPPGSAVAAPYSVGVAEFSEGIRIIGLLDEVVPPSVSDAVVPVLIEPAQGLTAYAFRRADGSL